MLAKRLGWAFLDADDLHPKANVEKMRAGVPLTDADRAPGWRPSAGWIDARAAAGAPRVVACSALKRAYRDRLRAAGRRCACVYLRGRASADRRAARSAAATTGRPRCWRASSRPSNRRRADEHAIVVDIGAAPEALAKAIARRLA